MPAEWNSEGDSILFVMKGDRDGLHKIHRAAGIGNKEDRRR